MASPNHVYTEEEIIKLFGTAYDLPKEDGDPEKAPYRFVSQWYIVKKSNPDTPVALPRDMRLKNYIIYGQLESDSGESSPVSIVIRPQNLWVIDRTHERRGIWIEPSDQDGSAWYWLRDPHADKQASLHLPIRARLGLFSNVIDLLQEQGPDGTDLYYAPPHFKLTPKQLHQRLSCSDDTEFQFKRSECAEYLPFQEPFDYELFEQQGGLAFCKQHMVGLAEGFDDSKLGRGMSNMKAKRAKAWTLEQYEESAKLAEERSQRHPWGEPLPNARKVHPNWKVDTNLDQARDNHLGKTKNRSKENDDSSQDEGFEDPGAGKRTRRHALEDSDDDDDEPRSKKKRKPVDAASKAKLDPMAEDRYSDERMIQALDQLKAFLTPVPSNETGLWEEVVKKKFRVTDVSSAKAMAAKIRKSDDLSHECKLLMVVAFRNVCQLEDKGKDEKKVLSQLFKKHGEENGIGILECWKRDSTATLDRLALLKEDNEWYRDIVAYRFLHEYIRFIKECFVVSEKKYLDRLNDDFGVPWNQENYLDDVKAFELKHAHASTVLRTACMLTRTHLKRIRNQTPAPAKAPAASPSAASAPAPASVSAPAVSGPSSAKAETAMFTENEKRERDEKSAAVDEAARKKLKFADERRKKLLERAKGVASQQVVPRPDARPTSQPIVSQGSARPPAASSNPSRIAPQVPNRPSAVASNPSSSSSDALPDNWSIWLNRPRTLTASEETFAPVTGNEFFFLKPLPPSNAVPAPAAAVPPRREPQQDRGRESGARETASGGYSQSSRDRQQPQRRESSSKQGYRSRDDGRQAPSNERSFQSSRGSSLDDTRSRRDDERSHDRDSRPRGYGQDRHINDRQDRAPAFGAADEAGGGSGRGRGRHMTESAWMRTAGQQPAAVRQDPVQETASGGRGQPLQPVQPVVRQDPVQDMSSRGRGRGRTLPAWMTQKGGGSGPLPQANGGNGPLPQANSAPVRENGNLNGHNPTGVRDGGAAGGTGGGRGRGRGQHMTQPAWMTRQQG